MKSKAELKAKYVQRFKDIYKEETGKDLSDDEALEHFESLITLVKAVYKPIPKDRER